MYCLQSISTNIAPDWNTQFMNIKSGCFPAIPALTTVDNLNHILQLLNDYTHLIQVKDGKGDMQC